MTFELSFAAFSDLRGKSFQVSRQGVAPIELELVEIEDLGRPERKLPSNVRQDPFQLTLRGPLEPLLPQSMYTFTTEDQGSIELFMVPTGPDDGSNWYNVVVN